MDSILTCKMYIALVDRSGSFSVYTVPIAPLFFEQKNCKKVKTEEDWRKSSKEVRGKPRTREDKNSSSSNDPILSVITLNCENLFLRSRCFQT